MSLRIHTFRLNSEFVFRILVSSLQCLFFRENSVESLFSDSGDFFLILYFHMLEWFLNIMWLCVVIDKQN